MAKSERKIIHVDMDAFFAAVEVLDDPSLRGKPVIVGGTPEGRGVVAAASYEARSFGVHSAMSAARAVKLCPHGVFLRGRRHRYAEVSQQILEIYRRYTPLVEPLSIDEAFLDVAGSQRLFGPAEKIGREIKRCIRQEIGLTASVGVAPNKFLAKLASDLDKPDGFFIITDGNLHSVLGDLPVTRLWGVGPATQKLLQRLGVVTIGDLLHLSRQELTSRLGEHGDHLWELANGIDERPVIPDHEAKSIGHEVTFAEDIGEAGELQDILDDLVAQVARRLRDHHLLARTVQLKARYPDFTTCTRAETLAEATDATVVMRDTARALLQRRLGRRGRPLRLLGVSVSNLVSAERDQAELFQDRRASRQRTLDRVLDQVQDKFGNHTMRRGTPRD